ALAQVLKTSHRYGEARAALNRSLTLAGNDGRRCEVLTAFVSIHYYLGEYAATEEAANEALACKEKLYGAENRSAAYILGFLASAQHGAGRLGLAVETGRRSLAIYEKTLEANHPELASALANLGETETHAGELDAAKRHIERAVSIMV